MNDVNIIKMYVLYSIIYCFSLLIQLLAVRGSNKLFLLIYSVFNTCHNPELSLLQQSEPACTHSVHRGSCNVVKWLVLVHHLKQ